jgi:dihydrolipoamide dehydrogenase
MKEIGVQLAILGGGPAGYVAAIRAAQLGVAVALIEERDLGGTCLNRGCIPTKALLKTSEMAYLIRKSKELGIAATLDDVDWNLAVARKDRVVKNLRMGLEHLMKLNGISLVQGRGRIESRNRILVATSDEDTAVNCEKLIITTGSEPLLPEIEGIHLDGVITSDEALELQEIPDRLVIIGAGAIGLEFATMFNSAGSHVTVVEIQEGILPQLDREIADELLKVMKRQGIKFRLGSRVEKIAEGGGELVVVIDEKGAATTVKATTVLVAVGRRLRSFSEDILALGLRLDRGRIVVDELMETSIEGIYAAGDVIGGSLLAHLAFAEGRTAAQNALGYRSRLNYEAVPSCVYTNPEVASVGLNEEIAKERGIEVGAGRFYFRSNGRALCKGARDGLVKVVTDKKTGIVLGAQILGDSAAEMISEVTLAITLRARAEVLADMIHPHPTLSEAIMEACGDAVGRAIHSNRVGDRRSQG